MTSYSTFLADDGFVIFLFHGVIRRQRHAVRNYTRKHLLADRFDEVLRDLCAHGTPISMGEIADGADVPRKAFAVTFDDGFENNFSVASPLLEKRSVPATFYVTTGFVGTNQMSWIDMIEYAFERCSTVSVRLPGSPADLAAASPEEKKAVLDRIRDEIKKCRDIDPYEFARAVCRRHGIETFDPDPDLDRKLTWGQVAELARHPLFLVGGHSHTHRVLTALCPDELEDEVAVNLRLLEEHVHAPVVHYSYPEGLDFCYSDEVIACLQRHGIRCSPTAMPGTNHRGDDLFHLKRIFVV